jgi:hypothetical protein
MDAQTKANYAAMSWRDAITQACEPLIQKQKAFTATDFKDVDETEAETLLNELESLEHDVMLAWAYSTQDMNPTMIKDVERGRMKLTISKKRYIEDHTNVRF